MGYWAERAPELIGGTAKNGKGCCDYSRSDALLARLVTVANEDMIRTTGTYLLISTVRKA